MPRRREVPKREVLPDPKFGSAEISKFVNVLMTAAKKPLPSGLFMARLSRLRRKAARTRWRCLLRLWGMCVLPSK